MAVYDVLCWQEIPSQVRAKDGGEEVSLELSPRFMVHIDKVAMERGLSGTDEYLDGWKWSETQERPGTAREVAEAVKKELEEGFRAVS